jgi:hypothetical protein
MNETDPLDPLRRRAFRHAFEDGAIDLACGFFTLIVGLATQRRIFLGLSVVYLGAIALAWRGIHDRLTGPRTGYAVVPGDPSSLLLSVILLAGCLTMSVVAGFTLTAGRLWGLEAWPTWAPVLSGVVLAGGLLHTGLRTGLPRYHLYAAVAIGASVFFWLFPFGPRINPSDRLTLSLFVMAGVLLAGGGITVGRFVRGWPIESKEIPGGL